MTRTFITASAGPKVSKAEIDALASQLAQVGDDLERQLSSPQLAETIARSIANAVAPLTALASGSEPKSAEKGALAKRRPVFSKGASGWLIANADAPPQNKFLLPKAD